MGRSYPIWNNITSCAYKSGKSYGIKLHGEVEILIGTSASNSHLFLKTSTTHRQHENGDREYHFYIDNVLIRKAIQPAGTKEMLIEKVKGV